MSNSIRKFNPEIDQISLVIFDLGELVKKVNFFVNFFKKVNFLSKFR